MVTSRLRGAWAEARRILVVRLDAMGDVLMTTPAFRALAQSAPDVHLTLLTSPAGAAIASLLPEIDAVEVHEVPWMKQPPAAGRSTDAAGAARRLIDRLRAGRYDAAVIFTVHSQSALPAALVCLLAEIPLRLAHSRENPYALLTDWVPDPETDAPIRHETRRQLDLVATIGATVEDEHLSVRVPPAAARWIRALLWTVGIEPATRWALIAPGASAPSRRYPADGFATIARALVADHGWRIVVTGTAEERPLAEAVAADLAPSAVVLAGSLTPGELAALVAVAPVVVANNSGTAHLAAAVGTPVVEAYALTNLQHAPWGVASRVLAHDVPCKGCRKSVCPLGHDACLTRLDPADLVAAALDITGEGTAETISADAPAMPPGVLTPDVPAMPPGVLTPDVLPARVGSQGPGR
jgi:lipopolysaccharide heptosyltransferase II